MNAKSTAPNPNWIHPDDAPELNKAWFETATPMIGQKQVTRQMWLASVEAKKRGRPLGSVKADAKQVATLRFDPDVLAALRATGDGWQTRVNNTLRASLQLAGRLG